MPKKTKNRSSKQAKQRRQAKARAVRQDQALDAIWEATEATFPAVLAAGEFRVMHNGQEVVVTLEDIRQRVNALPDQQPLENLDQVADMLRYEISELELIFLNPDGFWHLPEEYLPKAGQA